jgi:hypothetical protein
VIQADVPERRCPSCRAKLEAVTSLKHNDQPKPGDISVCLYCAAVLQFGNGMTLRAVPKEEWEDFHPETVETLRAARAHCGVRS